MKVCPICSSPMEAKALGALSVQEGPLKLSVEAMPALVCGKNHKLPIHREYLLWVIGELRAKQGELPFGRAEGMLLKKYLCGACGKELAKNPERRQAFPFDLKYEDTPAFKVGIELPMYKCTACGKEQARSAKLLSGNVAAAVASLNDAAGFPHSG